MEWLNQRLGMEWSTRRVGLGGLLLQVFAVFLFLILLVIQKFANGTIAVFLLGASGRLLLLAFLVTLIGMFVDKKNALSVVIMLLTFPILTLMALLQGIW